MSEERFAQIETALAALQEQQARSQNQIDGSIESQGNLTETQRAILNDVEAKIQAQLAQQITVMQTQVAAIQSQLISLQLENSRLIEQLKIYNLPLGSRLSRKQRIVVVVVLAVLFLL